MAELFAKYEVNNTPWWPRMARLIGGSVALHLILSACALYIPAVRSMLNIAGEFAGMQYVNENYDKTLIGERAQIIEFPQEKFRYPDGYFQANMTPEQLAALQQQQVQVVQYAPAPPVVPRFRTTRPLVIPKSQPSPTPAASPSPKPSPTPANPNSAGTVANNETKLSPEEEKKLDQIAAASGIKRPKAINKKPFTDWLANAVKMKNSGELDLNGTIEIVAEADRQPDGKLANVEVTQKTGDPKLTDLAKDLIAAVSDSGALDFLVGTEHMVLTLKMDNTDIEASVTTEMKSPEEASKTAQGYNSLIGASSLFKVGGEEAATIYKNTKVAADGKQVILKFSMPRQTAGDMIKKQLPPTS